MVLSVDKFVSKILNCENKAINLYENYDELEYKTLKNSVKYDKIDVGINCKSESAINTQKDYINKLKINFPFIFDHIGKNAILTGGGLFDALSNFDSEYDKTNMDYDIFLFGDKDDQVETLCYIAEILKTNYQNIKITNVGGYNSVYEFTGCKSPIQVILSDYDTAQEVVMDFDLNYIKSYAYLYDLETVYCPKQTFLSYIYLTDIIKKPLTEKHYKRQIKSMKKGISLILLEEKICKYNKTSFFEKEREVIKREMCIDELNKTSHSFLKSNSERSYLYSGDKFVWSKNFNVNQRFTYSGLLNRFELKNVMLSTKKYYDYEILRNGSHFLKIFVPENNKIYERILSINKIASEKNQNKIDKDWKDLDRKKKIMIHYHNLINTIDNGAWLVGKCHKNLKFGDGNKSYRNLFDYLREKGNMCKCNLVIEIFTLYDVVKFDNTINNYTRFKLLKIEMLE